MYNNNCMIPNIMPLQTCIQIQTHGFKAGRDKICKIKISWNKWNKF